MKNHVIHLLCLGLAGLGCLEARDRPNVVLILADDLGYGDTGVYGSQQIPTKAIDSLAADGVRFTQAYVNSPVCAPSRAGLMTGRHPLSFGFCDNLSKPQPGSVPEAYGLPLSERTVADRLKELGYVTGIIGKWHLGELPQHRPEKRGFDKFWGYLIGGHDYFTADDPNSSLKSPLLSNYKTPQEITYLTEDTGDECVDFIEAHRFEPFFLFASFGAPHTPMQALERDLEKFAHIEDPLRRTYCAMVYRLDRNVGKILSALDRTGLKGNTLVVFMSDNGGQSAPLISNGSINAPLRGSKTTVLEGGIRVPLILSWPSRLPLGSMVDELVWGIDLCPTFVNAAGGRVEAAQDSYHGRSLLPLLTNPVHQSDERVMIWRYTVGAAIRQGGWKLVRLPDRPAALYRLEEDLAEQHNLAAQFPEIARELNRTLGQMEVRLPNPLFREPADWRVRHLKFYDSSYSLTQPTNQPSQKTGE